MKFLFEITVALLVGFITIAFGALVIWLVGFPFDLNLTESMGFSILGFVFLLPAFLSLKDMLRPADQEEWSERLCSGVRCLGGIAMAISLVLPWITLDATFVTFLWLSIGGFILLIGSIPIQGWLRLRRLKKSGVMTIGPNGEQIIAGNPLDAE